MTYIAGLTLKIDGTDASTDLIEDILQVSVEESLHLPSMFTIVIKNDKLAGRSSDTFWKHESLFDVGKAIEIGFTSSTTDQMTTQTTGIVLKGEITGIDAQFTSSSTAPIIVRGYDVAHRLHRGRWNRSFVNVTDSDIVTQIIGEVGITAGTITSTSTVNKYVFQENQTNMEFLRERAARNGFELFVKDGKLDFRAPTNDGGVTLTWLTNLFSFRVRVSSAEQVSSVEVRGWDYVTNKTAIVSSKTSATTLTSNSFGTGTAKASSFNGKPTSPKVTVVDQPVWAQGESDLIAQSLLNELAGEFIHADGLADGNTNIRPGKVVTVADMGKYSGSYYVTATRHLYQERVYTTHFSVRGLRGGDLLATLSHKPRLQPGQTLLVGVVSNNVDPDKLGRVKVKFPTLTEEHESNWARVVAIGAGANRGFDVLPEVNDEVLVGFEHGDIHRPYVIGGVWNKNDAPPTSVDNSVPGTDGKVRLRTFQTRFGQSLQFVEEDKDSSKNGIYLISKDSNGACHTVSLNNTDKTIEIKTKDGHTITLQDSNQGKQNITITTSGGHSITLDDQNKKVEVKSNSGHKVTMDDNGRSMEVISIGDITAKSGTSGSANDITLKGGNINLTATQSITISANSSIDLKVGASKVSLSNSGVDIKGAMTNMEATANAKVAGNAIASLEGSAMAKVQGGIVKIN
jgi:uncharacterized protein involved in type VI secretion and phage assembly